MLRLSESNKLFQCTMSTLMLFWLGFASHAPGQNFPQKDATVLVLVELSDLPSAQLFAEKLTADGSTSKNNALKTAQRHLTHLDALQRELLPQLTAAPIKARVLYRLQRVLNGIAVQVEARHLERIRKLPGVVSVRALVPKQPATSTSVPFVGAPTLWDASGLGLLGTGLSIGVVDTGIDYLHTDFGGSGLAADYAANDPTTIADGFFPTAKVVGGFDFVGDAYDASNPAHAVPIPDTDPMDCDGHGTHVAGIAAGLGVASDGSTYVGGYGPSTDFASLRVGPGVAPGADLYALRVFGCSGSTAVVEQAIEWAVDPNQDGDFADHLDVLNLSLTAPFSNGEDATAIAANNAALAGVLVVAAAGNDGQVHFIAGSPAAADRALGVAVVWDDDLRGGGVRVTSPPSISATHQAGGAGFGPPLTLPGISGEVALTEPVDACAPLTNAPAVTGKVALAERSNSCTPVTQARNAQNAGAIALVVINNVPSLSFLPNDGTGGDITITTALIRQMAGDSIRSQLPGVVDVELETVLLGDMSGSFSSRGPRRAAQDLALKPDLAAPGVAITSAGMGNAINGGQNAAIKSGTSMATPHVSGLMALLKELHPTWTPEQLKALAMNTARSVFFEPEQTPPVIPPSHMGSGRIGAATAANAGVIAYQRQQPEVVTLSFGHQEIQAASSLTMDVRVENLTGTAATYQLDLQVLSDLPGVSFSLPGGASVVVPAFGTSDVPVRVDFDPATMEHVRSSTLESVLGFDLHWLSEETAFLLLTPSAGSETAELRVPLHVSARPASQMSATSPFDLGEDLSDSTTLPLAGQGVMTGTSPPAAITSRVTPFELQQSFDPPAGTAQRSHLAHLGIASDFSAQPALGDTTIFFAVASHGVGSTPHTVRHEISIDVDRDGSDDFLLFNSDEGSLAFGVPIDAFISVLRDLGTQATTAQEPIDGFAPSARSTTVFQTEVMVLAVDASDLGLADGDSRFNYRVRSFDTTLENGTAELKNLPRATIITAAAPISEGDILTFDPAAPGFDFSPGLTGIPTRDDLPSTSLPLDFDLAALVENLSQGILLLHHHNLPGNRAEVVEVTASQLPDLGLAVTSTPEPALAGAELTYTLTATNLSPSLSAKQVSASTTLPSEVTFLPAPSSPECTEAAGTVECTFGDLVAAQNAQREIVVRIDRPLAVQTQFAVQAEVTSESLDPNALNDSDSATTTITDVLLDDGFESGTVEEWSTSVP